MILSSFSVTRIFHFETSQLECRVNMLSDARENVEFSAKVLNASTYPLSVEDDLPIDEFLFVQRSFNPFEIAACPPQTKDIKNSDRQTFGMIFC